VSTAAAAPAVSVVLAACEGEKYLAEQIDSVLAQTLKDFELVILDDASTDGTAKVAFAAARRDPRIRLERNPSRLGIRRNFLKAVSMARGRAIAFCDQDDVWRPDKLEILLGLLDGNPENKLAYSDLEVVGEDLRPLAPSFWAAAGIRPREGRLAERALFRNLSPGCSMMFVRGVKEAMDRLVPAPSFIAHDHLALILAAGMGRVVFTREKLVRYRQHAGNALGSAGRGTGFGRASVAETLKEGASRLKGLVPMDWPRLEAFAAGLEGRSAGPRLRYLDYFLFMRDDRPSQKLLGALECAAPGVYSALKGARP